MKEIFSTQKWPVMVVSLLILGGLSSGLVYAQVAQGTLTVNACTDQNADGDCSDPEDSSVTPAGVQACLNDETICQTIPATFTVAPGNYTAFLHFTGASQGYYPTTGRVSIDLADGAQETITLGAVYPIHPKGVAVHEQLNKVYAAFQGPLVISGTQRVKPYPFVAVIDGETDEVLYTIPGGPDGAVDPSPHTPNFAGIGRGPWGVAVSGDGQFVYTGSFEDGLVSYIDPVSDTVITNYFAGSDFMPTAPGVNPVTGLVHYPDYEQGHMLILSTDPANPQVAFPFIENPPLAFSPLELVTASSLGGYNFITLRDAIQPNPFKFVGLPSVAPFDLTFHDIILPGGGTGTPLALGLWQATGQNRLFITYADDSRDDPTPPFYANPNKLLLYDFDPSNPTSVTLAGQTDLERDYAEVGLVYNPAASHMLGTYAGFAYDDREGDVAACDSAERGGIYLTDFDGNVSDGPLPSIVVGNPPLVSGDLQWKNPFEIAINPNNGKVYVTDRCWNEFPGTSQPVGGAVLIFQDNTGQPTPTPTITTTATVTATPTITTTPTVTTTPTITTTPTVTATATPTATTTPGPNQITLVMNGPASVVPSETFSVTVVAENVPDPGLYGVQFEINYDPALISASNLQPNPAFSYVLFNDANNTTGKIRFVASRQGNVPGLTGNVTLLTFDATAANNASGDTTLTFEDEKIGDPQAVAFTVTTESYTVSIESGATPTPTGTVTATITPTVTTTPTVTITPTATVTTTVTPTATTTPPTETPTPTATTTPPTATLTPTATVTTTVTPTATTTPPTETPTPTATTTPPTSTPTPGDTAIVSGQITLQGRTSGNWSGATVTVDDSSQSATTSASGNFTITNVATGTHSSITADAPSYLPAVCTTPTVTAPETILSVINLLSGDLNDDNLINITDATTVGVSFGLTGPALPADLNQDGVVDILDIILVSVNFGQGSQVWDCLP